MVLLENAVGMNDIKYAISKIVRHLPKSLCSSGLSLQSRGDRTVVFKSTGCTRGY